MIILLLKFLYSWHLITFQSSISQYPQPCKTFLLNFCEVISFHNSSIEISKYKLKYHPVCTKEEYIYIYIYIHTYREREKEREREREKERDCFEPR